MIATAVRRAVRAALAPAAVALVVAACTMTLVEHGHQQTARQQLERRADVVEGALRSIDLDAERAVASLRGTLTVTSDPAQLDTAIDALVAAPSLVSTVAIVNSSGTVLATNQTSTLVTRASSDGAVVDGQQQSPSLVATDADEGRDRLVFAATSANSAGPTTIFVELTLVRSAFEDLPDDTSFVATVLDPSVGTTAVRTDAPLAPQHISRRVSLGGQAIELVVSGSSPTPTDGPWKAVALAALCAVVVTTTMRSAFRWRFERSRMSHDERLLDGVLAHQLRIEADLRGSETQLRAVLDSTPDTVALLEPSQQRLRLLNRPDLLGHRADAFETPGFFFSIAGDDIELLRAWWTSLSIAHGDAGVGLEFWATTATGAQRRVQLRAAPLRGTGLSPQQRCLGVITDITEQHEQREREREMREELEQARHLESLGQLAGGIAHDFRNVLAAVDMNAELLSARVLPEEHRYLDVIRRASSRAAEMVNQLLSFAKRELGEPVVVDLNAAVLAMESLLRSSVSSAVSIELDLDERPCVTRAGPGQLDRLVLNLVCNARDAMPLGGKIRIATLRASGALPPGAAERDWVLLAVTDDGVGIADDIIGKVFDPFFTTKGEAGSGLGLASVHGIVSALAGHVDITSSLGRGTTVTVAFPDEGRLPSSEAPPHEAAGTIADRRVILVDDDDDVRVATAGVLRDIGFDVVEASTAYEGLAALAQCPRAVLVTDIVMPGGMNGLDLAGVVRREFPDVEVVLISAYAGAMIGDRTPLPHRMLVKPVSTDDLLAALAEPRPLHAARSGANGPSGVSERVATDG